MLTEIWYAATRLVLWAAKQHAAWAIALAFTIGLSAAQVVHEFAQDRVASRYEARRLMQTEYLWW